MDLETLPFPIAYPLHYARRQSLTATHRINNALFAAYQCARLAALLMLSDYLENAEVNVALSGAISGLVNPHWGEWKSLGRTLAGYWGKQGRTPRFARLPAAWKSLTKESAEVKVRSGDDVHRLVAKGLAETHPFQTLHMLRNHRAHATGTVTEATEAKEQALAVAVATLAEQLAWRAFGVSPIQLVRVLTVGDDDRRLVRLTGVHESRLFTSEPIPDALTELARDGSLDAPLDLNPGIQDVFAPRGAFTRSVCLGQSAVLSSPAGVRRHHAQRLRPGIAERAAAGPRPAGAG